MKLCSHSVRAACLATLLVTASRAAAQSPAAAPKYGDDIIRLEEFTVSSTQSSGYRATNAITATGIGSAIGDTPLAISVVTGELVRDTAAYDLREALNLVPGVLTNPRSESAVTIRGFGGLISYRNGQYRRQLMTTWNMDRVEVIKGPAAIFFGAVRPGGIVNYVTAKPVFTGTFTDVKATVGIAGYLRGEVFHNQKINDKLAIRVGLGGYDAGGTRDLEYDHQYYMGLSAIYKPTTNQQFTIDLEGINRQLFYLSSYPVRALANSKVYGQPGAIAAQASINRQSTSADSANRSYLTSLGYSGNVTASNFYPLYDMFAPYAYDKPIAYDATQWQESKSVDFDHLIQITDNLVWQTTLNYAFDDTDGIQPSDGEVRPYADGSIRFRVEDFINIRDSYNWHTKGTYRFDLGPTKHTLQVGAEYLRVIFTRPGYMDSANRYNDSPGNTGSSSTNRYVTGFIPGVTPPTSIREVIAASGQTFNIVRKRWEDDWGYFFADQVRMLNDRVFFLGGARKNVFKGKVKFSRPISNSSLAPKAPGGVIDTDVIAAKGGTTPQGGVLIKALPGLSVFATYSESIEPNFSLDADGVASEPVESKSIDYGLKSELFNGRFTATLAYYDIDRENLAYRDTTREIATGRSPYYIFGNTEASEGIELDANWSVLDNYQVIFGWSHVTRAETTKSNNVTFAGRRFGGIPENTYVLWNRYTFVDGPAKGLSLGLGVRHNDETNLSQDPNNAVRIPAFTVWDAMASYKFRAGNREFSAQFNVKNAFDKLYREGSDGYFGPRRTMYFSLSTRF